MFEIKAQIDPTKKTISIVRNPHTNPLQELNDWLDATSMVAKRAREYQEMTKRDILNYCGTYLERKL